jgi:hypothetical protein
MEFDHQQAVSSQAVERYLLGELTSPLREAFEDHFFGCSHCAEALRTGSLLRENVRALSQAEPRIAPAAPAIAVSAVRSEGCANKGGLDKSPGTVAVDHSARWRSWFQVPVLVPWAAALLLLVVVLKQQSDLTASLPVQSAAYINLRSETRGGGTMRSAEGSPSVIVTGSAMISITVDVPSDGSYSWTLRKAVTQAEGTAHHGSGEARNGVLAVILDSRRMEAGDYVIAVRGAGSTTLPDRLYQFTLRQEHPPNASPH